MELKGILTESEWKTRKVWVALLFIGIWMNAMVFFVLLGTEKIPTPGIEIAFPFRIFGFATGVTFSYLYYALCYQRRTTFLLTFSLAAFWVSLIADLVFFLKGALQVDLFFVFSLVFRTISYIFTWKLRHLNKALKGYAKFPEESREATALIQSAASKEELQNLFSDGVKKWPRLKGVLERERKIKSIAIVG
jgi:hypothetical protein